MSKNIRMNNIGIRFKEGDKYPFIYDTETGNELKGIVSIEWSVDVYSNQPPGTPDAPRITIVAEAGFFEVEGRAEVELQ